MRIQLITGIFLLQILCTPLFAQITLTLQPDAENGKDAYIHDLDVYQNLGDHQDFAAIAWTCSSAPCYARGLIDFDLSAISNTSIIVDAKLSLYHNPTTPNTGHSGANESLLQRITSPWDEFTVAWINQPVSTSLNQVILPQSTSDDEDYIDIDVTDLVQDMINNPENSFGFKLKLLSETPYSSLIFASSDNQNSQLHPKLVIQYYQTSDVPETGNSDEFITVSPNPFSNMLSINFNKVYSEKLTIKIYTLQGQLVKLYFEEPRKIIEISDIELKNGLYYMQISDNKNINVNKKIIVVN